jgi:hypothetical protein
MRLSRDGATPTKGASTLRGHIVETTYLGELAQHTVELAGKIRVKVAALNPAAAHSRANEPVSLTIEAADVVILPA